MSFPLTPETVRDYMDLEEDDTSKYSDATIGSNIRTALRIVERRTHRLFGDRTQTLVFTTQGKPFVTIPGLREASSITLAGSSLTADQTYHLIPDAQQTGLYTGIQLRGFEQRTDGPWWLASPEWFDRNLDSPYHPANRALSSVPNDLVIEGDWGYEDDVDEVPDDVLMAVKVMAAHLTKLADANAAGAIATPEGNVFDLSNYPALVQDFIESWSISPGVGS